MGSSNRHWPSMFKSKPCNTNHHQWQPHDQIISSGCHRNPYTSGLGSEERTPEPKPRWNPRPEQIRILESIFNSGMVNPPRDEIRKIRAQLQEYGQVGDANVFYWFQNRKSRSKHKQRQLHSAAAGKNQPAAAPPTAVVVPSSSSSSSDKTSSEKSISLGPTSTVIQDLLNSPTASVNQPFLQGSSEFLAEAPFLFGGGGGGGSTSAGLPQGFCFPEAAEHSGTVGSCQSFLLSELMLMSGHCSSKKDDDFEKMKADHMSLGYNVGTNAQNTADTIASSISPFKAEVLQGAGTVGEQGPTKSTVFINDVCFEVGVGPFSVREAFGYDAVLVHSSGQPVLTNEWGVTLQPLQQGAFYYLLRPFTAPHDRTIDLI